MKTVDMDTVDLVHSGEAWPHPHPPCSRQMLQFLERNEGVVTWVQPKGGTVEDQYPVIRIGGEYYTMSLRMMKAVWFVRGLQKVGGIELTGTLTGGACGCARGS